MSKNNTKPASEVQPSSTDNESRQEMYRDVSLIRDTTMTYLSMTLTRSRIRLKDAIDKMQEQLTFVSRDIERYGTSTKLNPLPNMLAEISELHEKVSILTEVARLQELPKKR